MDNGKERRKQKLAAEIMSLSTAALLLNMRFFARAVNRLALSPYGDGYSCDGRRLTYDPDLVLMRYKAGERLPLHDYMHMLLHCVFRHFSVGERLEQKYWDVACDIAVEAVILKTASAFCEIDNIDAKRAVIRKLEARTELATAERIYSYISRGGADEKELKELAALFCDDDHKIWYKNRRGEYEDEKKERTLPIGANEQSEEKLEKAPDGEGGGVSDEREGEKTDRQDDKPQQTIEQPAVSDTPPEPKDPTLEDWFEQHRMRDEKQLEQMWEDISKQISEELESFCKNAGDESRYLSRALKDVDRDRYDYTAFLRRFAVTGEVMKADEECFDIGFYSYGLSLYGDAALIEPLEYKETRAVKEFVIAIDTSGSVSGALVTSFLSKTYSILKSEESFFTKVKIYIIQCDTELREAVLITDDTELERYIRSFEAKGLGGTDFRPVFDYVDRLIEQGELKDLRGLVYFTDGFGEFPQKRTPYETAFAFMRSDYEHGKPDKIPAWALKVILEEDELLYG